MSATETQVFTQEDFAMMDAADVAALSPAAKAEYWQWKFEQAEADKARLQSSARKTASGGPSISQADFLQHGGYPTVKIGDQTLRLSPQVFSSGSYGYGFNGKLTSEVNGVPVKFQASINIVVAGSKPAA